MRRSTVESAGSRGGSNFAWDLLEGTLRLKGDSPPDAVRPVFEYRPGEGMCAVTGGYAHWGEDIPALVGAYVFAGDSRGLRLANGRVRDQGSPGREVANVSSFGKDAAGELYVLSLSGPVFRLVP